MSRTISWIARSILTIGMLAGCISQPATVPTITTSQSSEATRTISLTASLPTFTPATSPIPGGLYVDPGKELGSISPYIYGTNYGPWIALPASMIPDAKNAGMTIIRFPGGAWGDRNDLKDYQITQFIAFCNMLGAIPSFSVRLRNGTPEQAAALVKLVNIDKKYGVKYWSIGNEPDLYGQELNIPYDTPQFNQEWRAFALQMKAVDPTIILIGPEVSQFTPDPQKNKKDSAGRDWMIEFLKSNGDLVDIISIHRYPFPKIITESTSVNDLRKDAGEWTKIIRYLNALITETTGRHIPIAITEFSTHYNKAVGGEATPDSHFAGIWLGSLIGQFISEDVLIANQWLLTTSGDSGSWGLIGRGELRPTYYTYQMYKMFGVLQVFSSSDNQAVSIAAAKNKEGALTIMLVNLADESIAAPLSMTGYAISDSSQLWLFDKEHNVEKQPIADFIKHDQITLPGQSMVLLVINK